MVNYCCVYGCGKNSKTSKQLYYYSLPKERHRMLLWLEAIGREDLLEKDPKKLNHRVCSRHFAPASIKNKHLCADAVPTLCLPNSWSDGIPEAAEDQSAHSDITCNSCNKPVLGFRYKCIACPDYDLCSKCEMFEAHAQHYLLRIPKPVNFKIADDLIKKWQTFFKQEQVKLGNDMDCSSDDDVPITKYVKNYDSGNDLSEEVKTMIRNEVTRVLSMKKPDKYDDEETKKRAQIKKKKVTVKRKKVDETAVKIIGTEIAIAPEVAFADVNDLKGNQVLDVKDELPNTLTPLEETDPPMINMKLNDELSEFLIGVKYPLA